MNKRQRDLFFYWINERHKIYLNKEEERDWPWTKDKILQEYKFTNVFRQLDKVTKELTKRMRSRGKEDEGLLFFNIALFRMFNLPSTYDNLGGWQTKWGESKAKKILHRVKSEGGQVFTGAYIITNAGSTRPKIDLICEAVTQLWKDRKSIASEVKKVNSLEEATGILTRYNMIGKFIAYEIVTDLRHTKLLNKAKDIMTWANLGPGAKRGITRIWTGKLQGEIPRGFDYNQAMQDLLKESQGYSVLKKHVPKLEMRDVEHSLCEFDKYMRVKNKEGRPRSKYRRSDND